MGLANVDGKEPTADLTTMAGALGGDEGSDEVLTSAAAEDVDGEPVVREGLDVVRAALSNLGLVVTRLRCLKVSMNLLCKLNLLTTFLELFTIPAIVLDFGLGFGTLVCLVGESGLNLFCQF